MTLHNNARSSETKRGIYSCKTLPLNFAYPGVDSDDKVLLKSVLTSEIHFWYEIM